MSDNPFIDLMDEPVNEPINPAQPPKIETDNPFVLLLEDKEGIDQVKNSLAVNHGVKKQPDRQAEIIGLSNELKVPTSFVERNYDLIKEEKKKKEIRSLQDTNPSLKKFLNSPDRVAVIQDDIEGVKELDTIAGRFKFRVSDDKSTFKFQAKEAVKRGFQNMSDSVAIARAFHQAGDEDELISTIASNERARQKQSVDLPKYYTDFQDKLSREGKDLTKPWNDIVLGANQIWDGEIIDGLSKLAKGGADIVPEFLDVIGVIGSNPKSVALSSIESSPIMLGVFGGGAAGATIGSTVPVLGTAFGAIAGTFTASATMEYMSDLRSLLDDKGIDLTDEAQIRAALRDPELVSEAKTRAAKKGVTVAAFDALSTLVGGAAVRKGIEGTARGAVKGTIKSTVKGIAKAGITEAVSESAGEGLSQLVSRGELDVGETLLEGASSIFTGGFLGSVSYGVATSKNIRASLSPKVSEAASQVAQIINKTKEASDFSDNLVQIGEALNKSKLANRDQAAAIELLNESSGQAAVYFQAEDFKNHWEKAGESVLDKADELLPGGRKQYLESLEQGRAMEVPLADYVSKFKNEETYNELSQLAKQDLQSPNAIEAQALSANIPDLVKQLSEEAKVEKTRIENEISEFGAVKNELQGQFEAVGRSTKDANTIATFAATAIKRRAERTGRSVLDTYISRYIKTTDKAPGGNVLFQKELGNFEDLTYTQKGEDADGTGQKRRREVGQREDGFKIQVSTRSLKNSPKNIQHSNKAREAARRYQQKVGLPTRQQSEYVKVDINRARRIAEEFEKLEHNPNDPEVIEAYTALAEETKQQYQVLKDLNLKIDIITSDMENPYKNGSKDMVKDVEENGHIWLFPTMDGFGSRNVDLQNNPLLQLTGEFIGDYELTVNDMFRVVHDYFGHIKEGNGFGPIGEENAWQSHVRMFSPKAARAMTTETRGQNSWVNYGPYGEQNRNDPANTIFADQKIGLLPEWVMEEGQAKDVKETLKQKEDNKIRGFLDPSNPDYLLMGILTDANKSTELHELGHAFLEYMREDLDFINNISVDEGKPFTLDELPQELREEAEALIQDEMLAMLESVEVAKPGKRTGTIIDTGDKYESINLSESSTFPEWFAEVNVPKKDFKKVIESGKGVRYERIREKAIDILLNGFKSEKSATLIEPNNDFRALLNYRLIVDGKEVAPELTPFDLTTDQLQYKIDIENTLKHLGVESFDQITTEHHEQFARQWEAYLLEGKAPSQELRSVFKRFSAWLMSVYRSIRGIEESAGFKVNLTDDMRQIFDRMLATQDEINETLGEFGYGSSETKSFMEALNLNEADSDRLEQALEVAREEAFLELYRKQAEQQRKQKTKEYNADKKAIKERVTQEAESDPVFNAIEAIKTNSIKGEPIDMYDTIKLNTEMLKGYLSDEEISKFPQALYSAKGIDPRAVAEMLGFEDASSMINQILQTPSKEAFINAKTQAELDQKYPNFMSPLQQNEFKQAAIDSVNNDKVEKLLKTELDLMFKQSPSEVKKLIKKFNNKLPTTKYIKDQALRTINKTTIRKASSKQYRIIENKNRRKAGEQFVRGNFEEAINSKIKETLNYELGRAAREVEAEVEKAIQNNKKRFNKSDKELAKKGNLDMMRSAEAVLAKFGLVSEAREKKLIEYLDNLKAYDPANYMKVKELSEELISGIEEKNYKDLTVQEFRDVMDTVEAISSLAEDDIHVNFDGQRVKKEVVLEQLSNTLDSIDSQALKNKNAKFFNIKKKVRSLEANMTRTEHFLRYLDGNKQGAFTKAIWNEADAAQSRYEAAIEKYKPELIKIVKENFDGVFSDKGDIDLTKYFTGLDPQLRTLKKHELVMALLHSGNDSNKKKLLLGRNWGQLDNDGNLVSKDYDNMILDLIDQGIIDKKMMDGVQAIWNLYEGIKPEIQKAHKAEFGYFFKEVEAKKFDTPFGEYRGGYFPAITDALLVDEQSIREAENSTILDKNTFGTPKTESGFTKSRVEAYNKALSLDFGLVNNHLIKSLRFAYIQPTLSNINKLVGNRKISEKIHSKNNFWNKNILRPFLARFAAQTSVKPGGEYSDVISFLRKSSNMQLMFLNLKNTVENLTDLTALFTEVGPMDALKTLTEFAFNSKEMTNEVTSMSPFMRTRLENQIFKINDTYEELLSDSGGVKGRLKTIGDVANRYTYIMQETLQNVVDVVSWQAAFDKYVSHGMSEAQAVKEADSAIRRTLSSGRAIDLSNIESGTQLQKAFLMFYGYFNNRFNLLRYGSKGKSKMKFYSLGVLAPAILSDILSKSFRGEFPPEDDDEILETTLSTLIGSQVSYVAAQVPYGGQALRYISSPFTKSQYDDRLSLSPVISNLEKLPMITRVLTKDEIRGNDIRGALEFFGTMSGIPIGYAGKPIGFMIDLEQGKQSAENPLDYIRGLTTGRSGKR